MFRCQKLKKLIKKLTRKFINFIASRRETNKFLNENFCGYLSSQITGNHKIELSVKIRTPQQEKCLQIVDMVCWSLFRKREHGDESYCNLIKSRIIEESPLYP